MRTNHHIKIAGNIALAAGLTLLLSGCSWDYWQRKDRVAYSAGDAVKANLERETANPAGASKKTTSDLGKNGPVPTALETNPAAQ